MKPSIELVVQPPVDVGATELDRLRAVRDAFPAAAARRRPGTPDGYWFERFGVARQHDWPAAAFRADDDGTGGTFACADPAGLAVQGSVVVVDAQAGADLGLADAQPYLDLLNRHFEADGLRFFAATPTQWVLRLPDTVDASTVPLAQAHRRSLATVAPRGPQAAQLQRLATEAQMLLHDCAPNQARAERGLAPINAIWLWGAGRRQAVASTTAPTRVLSQQAHVTGLARAAGAGTGPVPADAAGLADAEDSVAVDLAPTTLEGEAWTHWLERHWLAPLAERARRTGSAVSLVLLLPEGAVSAPLFRADWRRLVARRGLACFLERSARST